MNTPGGNFANGAIWYTIVFNVSVINFLCQIKLEIKTVCFENPSLNPNNYYAAVVKHPCFS